MDLKEVLDRLLSSLKGPISDSMLVSFGECKSPSFVRPYGLRSGRDGIPAYLRRMTCFAKDTEARVGESR